MEVKLSMGLAMRLGLDKDGLFRNNSEKSLVDLGNAIAFAARMKDRGCSNFRHYNVNKLRDKYQELFKVRLHWETVKGYIDTLIKFGLCAIRDGQLYFKRLKSKRQERNYIVSFSDDDTIRTAGREFAKFIFSSPMRSIGYKSELKRMITDPKDYNELIHARKKIRRLGLDIDDFDDNGISYNTLAARFHISKTYVVEFIDICTKAKILAKIKHCKPMIYTHASEFVSNKERLFCLVTGNVTFYTYDDYTDVLRTYNVLANTYAYNPYHIQELDYEPPTALMKVLV